MSADETTGRSGTRRGLVGRVLGDRYRVTRMVSAGANTVIADAEDEELSRPVTIKLVRPEWAESPEFRGRFTKTMKAMSSISHPNIAAVHDWGDEEIGRRTTAYAVVEYLAGGSMRDLFDRGRYLDPSQALVVGLEACRGLDFAHSKGWVHTELSPAKLVFGDDRRLRIVDFGLARLLGQHDWAEPATVATHVARYASPEQALAQPVDGKTDVYSLTLILVEAVTGTVPFAARSTVATLSARIGRLMPVSADLGPLASVFERAGRPEPAERSTAAELGRALVRAAEKLPRPSPIPIIPATRFDDDPSRLRRPNDPTGGVQRPDDAPATAASALVPPVPPEPLVPSEPSPPVDDAATAAAEGLAPAAPLVEPRVEPDGEPEQSPTVYDGDVDATVDELAALARPSDDPQPATVVPTVAVASQPASTDELDVIGDAPLERGAAASGEARPRRRWWIAVLAVLVVGALGGLGYLAYTLFRTPTHEVPALAGLDEGSAAELTADFDWEVDIQRERSDEVPEEGTIIRTAPAAGEQLAEGEPFLVVVSEGPELRTLPDFAGLALSEAETTVAELRLVALPATEQFDEEVPAGDVLSWSIPADPSLTAGDEVLPETEVGLVVSAGPAARTIPELIGLSVADATAQLQALALTVTVGAPVFSDTIPVDGVTSTEPVATSTVARGTGVTLVPSKGVDLVTMPDLTGQALAQVQTTLATAGLNVGSLLGSTQGVFVSATVAGDPAEPGAQYKRATAVDLIFL